MLCSFSLFLSSLGLEPSNLVLFILLASAVRIRPQTAQDSINIPARFQRSVIQATSGTAVTVDAVAAAAASGAPAAGVTSAAAPPLKKQSFSFVQMLNF